MRVVSISDTHLQHAFEVPDGDLLIHAGDGTNHGTAQEVERFAEWIGGLPHTYKVLCPGNHDFLAQRNEAEYRHILSASGVDHVLIHESCVVEGLKIFGSPWTPWFHDWAFNMPKGEAGEQFAAALWAAMPPDSDIVVTHGPPRGVLDRVNRGGLNVGCAFLAARVSEVHPQLHVFGHIHESAGCVNIAGTLYVNASILDLSYGVATAPKCWSCNVRKPILPP